MLSGVQSGTNLQFGIYKIGIFPDQRKMKEMLNDFVIIIETDQSQPFTFVHLTDTRPMNRDQSTCRGNWEREHAGYLLFISGLRQLIANTTQTSTVRITSPISVNVEIDLDISVGIIPHLRSFVMRPCLCMATIGQKVCHGKM